MSFNAPSQNSYVQTAILSSFSGYVFTTNFYSFPGLCRRVFKLKISSGIRRKDFAIHNSYNVWRFISYQSVSCFKMKENRAPTSVKVGVHHMVFYYRVDDIFKGWKAIWMIKSFSKIKDLARLIPPFVSTPFLLDRRHSSGSEAPPKASTPVKLIVDSEVRVRLH